MAFENNILMKSYEAAEDLSSDQYRFVVLTSTGTVRRPDSATEVPIGVLQNAPAAGETAAVMIMGISKFQANGALGLGAYVMHEYVSATDAGKGADASANLDRSRGVVVAASGAEDDIASILLTGPIPVLAGAVGDYTITTDSTAGANTYSAAELIGGLILRDPAGDNRSDVTPTAAQIVAGLAGAAAGKGFEFTIRNTADAAETITITAGTGVTLSGTMTIAQNNSKRFLAVVTNAGSGAEAVTIYSLGTVVH